MNLKTDIPILIDFDGVIRIGENPAKGLDQFIKFIYAHDIKAIIVSNSTLKPAEKIKEFFTRNNFEINIPIITAVDATLSYVKEHYKRICIFCNQEIEEIFCDYIDDDNPEVIIIGDLGENWSSQILNEIFQKVNKDVDFIAMQKNKFWKPDGKNLELDAGSYIAAIEYATGKEAKLIGKPSPIYFQTAIEQLGFKEKFPFIMIGDDLETDIYAAQNIGGIGILVYTGKTKYPLPANLPVKPDYEAQNLLDVIELLKRKFD